MMIRVPSPLVNRLPTPNSEAMAPMPERVSNRTTHGRKHTLALVAGLSELGDHGVSRMRDNCADNTSNVAGSEGNAELSGLGILRAGLGEDVLVEHLNHLLKEVELGLQRSESHTKEARADHGVGDLTTPQGDKGSKGEACLSLVLRHLLGGLNQASRPCSLRGGLNLHLNHFHGAEGNVGEELGRCGGREPDRQGQVEEGGGRYQT
jgi:hypothetical protein